MSGRRQPHTPTDNVRQHHSPASLHPIHERVPVLTPQFQYRILIIEIFRTPRHIHHQVPDNRLRSCIGHEGNAEHRAREFFRRKNEQRATHGAVDRLVPCAAATVRPDTKPVPVSVSVVETLTRKGFGATAAMTGGACTMSEKLVVPPSGLVSVMTSVPTVLAVTDSTKVVGVSETTVSADPLFCATVMPDTKPVPVTVTVRA